MSKFKSSDIAASKRFTVLNDARQLKRFSKLPFRLSKFMPPKAKTIENPILRF